MHAKILSMKRKWNILTNSISAILVGFIIFKQVPAVWNNFEKEGSSLSTKEYVDSRTNEKTIFPRKDQRAIGIFWATWCGPCKIEMDRLHKSVVQGKLNASQIYAINAFESQDDISRFIRKSQYSFNFISSPYATRQLAVKSTPTTIFLDGESVTSISSGLSLVGIWRAEQYLAQR